MGFFQKGFILKMSSLKNYLKIITKNIVFLLIMPLSSCSQINIQENHLINFTAVDSKKGNINFVPTFTILRDDYISDGKIIASDFNIESNTNSGQVVSIELLWLPKPGKTAIEETATNVTIQWLMFFNDSWGLYAGGGYAIPNGSIEDEYLELTIKNATLELLTASDDFDNKLGSVNASGSIKGALDLNTPVYFEKMIEERK